MNRRTFALIVLLCGFGVLTLGLGIQTALARRPESAPAKASPIHPTFALLDADGSQVIKSGKDVSTAQTCGQCHDTDFIASHAFHSDLGLSSYAPVMGDMNAGAGIFGQWDPLNYRYLSQTGDGRLDLSTSGWLMLNADRVVGGGPGITSRQGNPLTSLKPDATDPEASILDSVDNATLPWDWSKSGTLEMNCFLCHLESPNNAARIQSIQQGKFQQAATATLLGTGIVTRTTKAYFWNDAAFDTNGELFFPAGWPEAPNPVSPRLSPSAMPASLRAR